MSSEVQTQETYPFNKFKPYFHNNPLSEAYIRELPIGQIYGEDVFYRPEYKDKVQDEMGIIEEDGTKVFTRKRLNYVENLPSCFNITQHHEEMPLGEFEVDYLVTPEEYKSHSSYIAYEEHKLDEERIITIEDIPEHLRHTEMSKMMLAEAEKKREQLKINAAKKAEERRRKARNRRYVPERKFKTEPVFYYNYNYNSNYINQIEYHGQYHQQLAMMLNPQAFINYNQSQSQTVQQQQYPIQNSNQTNYNPYGVPGYNSSNNPNQQYNYYNPFPNYNQNNNPNFNERFWYLNNNGYHYTPYVSMQQQEEFRNQQIELAKIKYRKMCVWCGEEYDEEYAERLFDPYYDESIDKTDEQLAEDYQWNEMLRIMWYTDHPDPRYVSYEQALAYSIQTTLYEYHKALDNHSLCYFLEEDYPRMMREFWILENINKNADRDLRKTYNSHDYNELLKVHAASNPYLSRVLNRSENKSDEEVGLNELLLSRSNPNFKTQSKPSFLDNPEIIEQRRKYTEAILELAKGKPSSVINKRNEMRQEALNAPPLEPPKETERIVSKDGSIYLGHGITIKPINIGETTIIQEKEQNLNEG